MKFSIIDLKKRLRTRYMAKFYSIEDPEQFQRVKTWIEENIRETDVIVNSFPDRLYIELYLSEVTNATLLTLNFAEDEIDF